MRAKLWMAFLLLTMGLCVGCGGASDDTTGDDTEQPSAAGDSAAVPAGPLHKAGDVVNGQDLMGDPASLIAHQFLEACRRGDDDAIRATLTPIAREKMGAQAGRGLPASDYSSYQVTHVRYAQADVAQVAVVRTEVDPRTNAKTTENLAVIPKRTQEGWRVAALALELTPGGGDWFELPFEDPEKARTELERAATTLQQAAATAAAEQQRAMANAAPQSNTAPMTAAQPMPGNVYPANVPHTALNPMRTDAPQMMGNPMRSGTSPAPVRPY